STSPRTITSSALRPTTATATSLPRATRCPCSPRASPSSNESEHRRREPGDRFEEHREPRVSLAGREGIAPRAVLLEARGELRDDRRIVEGGGDLEIEPEAPVVEVRRA